MATQPVVINTATGQLMGDTAGTVTASSTTTFTNKTLDNPKVINGLLDANGNSMIGFGVAGSAVNYLTVQNGSTGNGVWLDAVGSDPNIALVLAPQGGGVITGWANSRADMQIVAAGSSTDVGWNLTTQNGGTVKANNVPVVTTTGTQTQTNKTLTAPTISAHTASAGTALKLASGTVMTTPEAGAYEYDGTVFYQTPNAGNRGLSPTYAMCRQDSAYTLTSTTSVQQLFNASANGRLTLPVGTYRFKALYYLTGMSATTGNSAFSLAGTATTGTILMYTVALNFSDTKDQVRSRMEDAIRASVESLSTATDAQTMEIVWLD